MNAQQIHELAQTLWLKGKFSSYNEAYRYVVYRLAPTPTLSQEECSKIAHESRPWGVK